VAAVAASSAAEGHADLIRHRVVQFDGFLSASEVAWLTELAFASDCSTGRNPARKHPGREREFFRLRRKARR